MTDKNTVIYHCLQAFAADWIKVKMVLFCCVLFVFCSLEIHSILHKQHSAQLFAMRLEMSYKLKSHGMDNIMLHFMVPWGRRLIDIEAVTT